MKKAIPYIIVGLIAMAVLILVRTSGNKNRLDERLTLNRKDKIPYGTWVAFRSLPVFFPSASVYTTRKEPGHWDSISIDDTHQAFIAITHNFFAEENELNRLIEFVSKGNDVFISAVQISYDVEKMITAGDISSLVNYGSGSRLFRNDSFQLSLLEPAYCKYSYPGKNLSRSFEKLNLRICRILGKYADGRPNFIHLKAGKGNLYLHLAPVAFSNYFLLHKNNITYYEKVMSYIHPDTKKILWDEYYLYKKYDRQQNKKISWIKVLARYPSLKAALLTALATLVVFILLEMRRKQRYIPILRRPRNDSLDFVKTIGRLYYEKGDHKNLCRKMSNWFLEYVRSRYKMATGPLDDSFIKNLQFKTGMEEDEIKKIIEFIRNLNSEKLVMANDVIEFHRRLENFYRKA